MARNKKGCNSLTCDTSQNISSVVINPASDYSDWRAPLCRRRLCLGYSKRLVKCVLCPFKSSQPSFPWLTMRCCFVRHPSKVQVGFLSLNSSRTRFLENELVRCSLLPWVWCASDFSPVTHVELQRASGFSARNSATFTENNSQSLNWCQLFD